ncbi:uncharacterized protein SPPG_09314 [Spizellomyces punctatus DAOM BR117]|uniref:ABC transporter domain-containing protein n=1 Tax=Spizellomyces punctatus (strain DAOM BR117) TaxID=645134 RepID=A0A0L0HDM5_SPIPD|nr:uncharacterized protein SPPG_09314 [Spizellomyces punctatus DAOM BR117]KNC98868.1 hypothetical protein SPPG_09314 [Spizellomyces punctatus DAOM BR117]|eukprot:XP_016606908.1 hypothetical protein SPPG_09314 [Spizellomyces punctatus DAOM BR117]
MVIKLRSKCLRMAIWLILMANCFAATYGTTTTITIPSGTAIRGRANQQGTFDFLGIRFAVAQRWEPAVLLNNATTIDAFNLRESCPQICQTVLCPDRISEDCLFMNVFTPIDDPSQFAVGGLPVLVFFHGGSFEIGGAGMGVYDASELAKALNVIVVSFNYRLGVFGFFDMTGVDPTLPSTYPRNFGILDQRLALQWVSINIAAFGGNSSDLTLMGQSAGAQSILIHRSHPSTRHFASKMILMSPPALALSSTRQAQIDAQKVAGRLGCANRTCLQEASMREVLNAKDGHVQEEEKRMSDIAFKTMPPIIDGVDVIANPFEILSQEVHMIGVKAIIGGVSNETYLFLEQGLSGDLSTPLFNVIVNALYAPNDGECQHMYGGDSEDFLANRKPILTRMTTDWVFLCPQRQSVRSSAAEVWSYVFEAPWLGGPEDALGNICKDMACHTTDLSFVMKMPDDAPSKQVTTALRDYIRVFITGTNTTSDLPIWLQSTSNTTAFPILRFPNPSTQTSGNYTPLSEASHPLSSYCDFWDTQGYEYAPIYSMTGITEAKAQASALSAAELSVALGLIGCIVLWELGLLLGGLILRQRLYGIFAAVYKSETEMSKAMQLGNAEAMSKYKTMSQEERPKPVVLECRNLTYRAGDVPEGKRLLDSVSFKCEPGTVTAIMGPSGAGKTTLLSLLNRRLMATTTQDKIYLAGKPLAEFNATTFRSMTGFVAQHDAPYYGLTVREVMMFNAMLELPTTKTHQDRVRRINRLLDLLNLAPCADVLIQRPESNKGGISGGQMRRLSIAVALLRRPSILFLDEPTSGLDAKSSLDVGNALSQLALQGYTVICSIHQPRTEMFQLFSQVTVLTYGRLLFSGSPNESVAHFTKLRNALATRNTSSGCLRTAEEDEKEDAVTNPADLILDVAGAIALRDAAWACAQWNLDGAGDVEAHIDDPVDADAGTGIATGPDAVLGERGQGTSAFFTTELGSGSLIPLRRPDSMDRLESGTARLTKTVHTIIPTTTIAPSLSVEAVQISTGKTWKKRRDPHRPGAFKQMLILTSRWWLTKPVPRKLNMTIISGCGVWILALLQRRPGDDALSIVLQTKGLALACVGLPALKNIHISFDYYEDRDIYNYDSQNGTVDPLSFFLHRLIYETAMATVEGFLAVISAYFLLGCNPDSLRIGTAMTLFVVYYNCTTTLFTLVYCTRLGRPEARSIAFFSQAVLAIASGIWIKKGDTSVYDVIAWFQYLNPTYWALSALIRTNAVGLGECLLEKDGVCQANLGDVIAEEARTENVSPANGLLALFIIWLVMRFLQFLFLLRDAYWDVFWSANKSRFGPAAWVRASQRVLDAATKKEMATQTGASLEGFEEFMQGLEENVEQTMEEAVGKVEKNDGKRTD